MNVGEDYIFRDDLEYDTVPIELTSGPFKGIVLRYTQVMVREQANESATIKFDYDLIKADTFNKSALKKDLKFQEHVGLVLNAMLIEAASDTGC